MIRSGVLFLCEKYFSDDTSREKILPSPINDLIVYDFFLLFRGKNKLIAFSSHTGIKRYECRIFQNKPNVASAFGQAIDIPSFHQKDYGNISG